MMFAICSGMGSSRNSQRQAANKMWNKLKDISVKPTTSHSIWRTMMRITQRVSQINHEFGELKEAKIPTLTTPHSHKVSQFHKNLKSSFGEKLNELQTVVLKNQGFNFVQFLQEIASEQQFEVTYVDIEEKSMTGHEEIVENEAVDRLVRAETVSQHKGPEPLMA
ncbi:RISC-loading complex subunit tarbp2 [Homalodisca vitripennis]|nr:RISC-loading complex subunit tarbp2 [Homalodisca vitripennis]